VEGESTKKIASRYNLNEVKAIVEWLRNNKDKIEAKYQICSMLPFLVRRTINSLENFLFLPVFKN
jgi:hypothetical protein